MTDTRAAAVAALAWTNAHLPRPDAAAGDYALEQGAVQLDAILASPEHRAALLAVLLTPEPIADVLGDALDGYGDPDQWAAAIIRRLTTTKEQT